MHDRVTTLGMDVDAAVRRISTTYEVRGLQENVYDGRNYRMVRRDYADSVLAETRHFYYSESWQSLEERLDSETDSERQHVWGLRYIDDLVCRDRDTDADGDLDERLFALQDANWNVTAVVDTTGAVQERYAYTAYGEPMVLTLQLEPSGAPHVVLSDSSQSPAIVIGLTDSGSRGVRISSVAGMPYVYVGVDADDDVKFEVMRLPQQEE